jgi:hypothetical protein
VLTVATQPLYQHKKEDPKLHPAELQFLLKDLVSKLEHRLVAAANLPVSLVAALFVT